MLGSESRRHQGRRRSIGILFAISAHRRKGAECCVSRPSEREQRRAVKPAREQPAHLDITLQMGFKRLAHRSMKALDCGVSGEFPGGWRGRPPTRRGDLRMRSSRADSNQTAGPNRPDAVDHRPFAERDSNGREVARERDRVDAPTHRGVLQQRSEFAREDQFLRFSGRHRPVERNDPEWVPCEIKRSVFGAVPRDREHASKTV